MGSSLALIHPCKEKGAWHSPTSAEEEGVVAWPQSGCVGGGGMGIWQQVRVVLLMAIAPLLSNFPTHGPDANISTLSARCNGCVGWRLSIWPVLQAIG